MLRYQKLDFISTRVTHIKNQFTPTEKIAEESVAAISQQNEFAVECSLLNFISLRDHPLLDKNSQMRRHCHRRQQTLIHLDLKKLIEKHSQMEINFFRIKITKKSGHCYVAWIIKKKVYNYLVSRLYVSQHVP